MPEVDDVDTSDEVVAEAIEADEPESPYAIGEEIGPQNDPLNPLNGGGVSEEEAMAARAANEVNKKYDEGGERRGERGALPPGSEPAELDG